MTGLGAMIHHLGGGSKESAEKYYGREIESAVLDGNVFRIKFSDGVSIEITDEGQSCCESRYITCDDKPSDLVGGKLKHIIVKDGPQPEASDDDYHEVAFLEVSTDKASITFCTHNEHNGYYGGFGLNISEVSS